jgi:hypothetical protein
MTNHYEAPEIVEIGKAQNVVLGIKDYPMMDNPGTEPEDYRTLWGIADNDE